MDASILDAALTSLGDRLQRHRRREELVAAGGSGLLLLGAISRPTYDVDVVAIVEGGRYRKARPLPPHLLEASRDVGEAFGIGPDWLNPGPTDLLDFGLPAGFEDRVQRRDYGGLVLHLASRLDQICFKLYAAADQGLRSKHVSDLRQLRPTREELMFAARWTMTHDPSPGFRSELLGTLRLLGVEDAHDL